METRSALPRGTLSKDLILKAALEIIDQEGMDALSLRKIAAQLGVSTMSLYRHYRNKAEIEVDIVDHVVGDYDVTDHDEDENDWAGWIHTTYAHMREGLCAHPGLMALLDNASLNTTYNGTNALEVMETILRRLHEAGLAAKPAAQLFHTLMSYMIGSVILMNQPARCAISGRSEDVGEETRMLKLAFEMVPLRLFPNIAEMAPHLAKAWDAEEFRDTVLTIIAAFAPPTAGAVRRATAVKTPAAIARPKKAPAGKAPVRKSAPAAAAKPKTPRTR